MPYSVAPAGQLGGDSAFTQTVWADQVTSETNVMVMLEPCTCEVDATFGDAGLRTLDTVIGSPQAATARMPPAAPSAKRLERDSMGRR